MIRTFIIGALLLSMYPVYYAHADGDCTVCGTHNDTTIQCNSKHGGHAIDGECLENQLKNLNVTDKSQAEQIKTLGVQCWDPDCDGRLTIQEMSRVFYEVLDVNREINNLTKRLDNACNAKDHHHAPIVSVPITAEEKEAAKLSHDVTEAFNIKCPKCGGVLDKIQGCNAAKCSNPRCLQTFCYLCLKPQRNNEAAHKHVRQHSGDYWEERDGHTGHTIEPGKDFQEKDRFGQPYTYENRYHWLLARKKLGVLFQGGLKAKILRSIFGRQDKRFQSKVINDLEALLKERKMWPFSAGMSTDLWISEVRQSDLSKEAKIELLQNEYIYLRNEKATERSKLVAHEIKSLNGRVLASFDIKDAGGASEFMQERIVPVLENDPRIHKRFAEIGIDEKMKPRGFFHRKKSYGSMYQIKHLILSDATLDQMNFKDAFYFCKERGARLPTVEEWEKTIFPALVRNGAYDLNTIPNMALRTFWTSFHKVNEDQIPSYKSDFGSNITAANFQEGGNHEFERGQGKRTSYLQNWRFQDRPVVKCKETQVEESNFVRCVIDTQ